MSLELSDPYSCSHVAVDYRNLARHMARPLQLHVGLLSQIASLCVFFTSVSSWQYGAQTPVILCHQGPCHGRTLDNNYRQC